MNLSTIDFSNTSVIRPPFEQFKNKEIKRKQTRFIIDSRTRDRNLYPDPSQYVINLDDPIEDVTSAQITTYNIPLEAYMVNKYNNNLFIKMNNTHFLINISVGDYDAVSLERELERSINIQQNVLHFSVVYCHIKDNYIFNADGPFQLVFSDTKGLYTNGTIGKVIGFGPDTYSSSFVDGRYTLQSRYKKNFSEQKYAILHIEQMSLHHSESDIINKCFNIVQPLIATFTTQCNQPIKYFNPPIARLTKLKLTFRDFNGNLYDFQNHDHRIDILFESNKHLRKFQDFC